MTPPGDDTLEAVQKPIANELRIRGQVDEALNTLLKSELLRPGQWLFIEGFKTGWNHICGFFKLIFGLCHWVFIAACRLSSSCGSWAPHCGGFSCCRAGALGRRLSGYGT